jgi:large subunit ribosomal protein L18Ae
VTWTFVTLLLLLFVLLFLLLVLLFLLTFGCAQPQVVEYQVIGRKKPTDTDPSPVVYRMRLFAPDHVRAKSRFWYFLSKTTKVKKASGEILSVNRIYEKNPLDVKNFGILIKYDSRSGTHNMYKEYRDVTRAGAVNQLYSDMASRHRARYQSIQIIEIKEIANEDVVRPHIKGILAPDLRFPLPNRFHRPPTRQLRSKYIAKRPHTYYK